MLHHIFVWFGCPGLIWPLRRRFINGGKKDKDRWRASNSAHCTNAQLLKTPLLVDRAAATGEQEEEGKQRAHFLRVLNAIGLPAACPPPRKSRFGACVERVALRLAGRLPWLKTWSSSFGRRASRASCRPRSRRSRTCGTASRCRRRSCSSCGGAWRRGSTQRICSRRSSGCPARCTRQYGLLCTPPLHPRRSAPRSASTPAHPLAARYT